MRKSVGHFVLACSVLVPVLAVLYLCWDRLRLPPDPEATLDAIVVDGDIPKVRLLHREDFPLEVLIHHLNDERAMRRSMYATHGPNRAWMVCSRVIKARLGLGGDPEVSGKWLFPIPDSFPDRTGFAAWWEASTKDELRIRHEMASWQLAEMERSPKQFEPHLSFKRRQVAEARRRLADR